MSSCDISWSHTRLWICSVYIIYVVSSNKPQIPILSLLPERALITWILHKISLISLPWLDFPKHKTAYAISTFQDLAVNTMITLLCLSMLHRTSSASITSNIPSIALVVQLWNWILLVCSLRLKTIWVISTFASLVPYVKYSHLFWLMGSLEPV